MFNFNGKVVVVSGASGNLGRAAAEAFLASGASLVVGDRNISRSRDYFGEHAHICYQAVDFMNPDEVEGFIAAGLNQFGKIDVLVNTIGGFRTGKVVDTKPEDWEFMFELNLRPAYLLSRAVLPAMLSRQSGKIIHTSARSALSGTARLAAYSASKSALMRMVESLSAEVKDQGITVNCILPGTIDTPQNRQDMPNADFNRWVAPEEIAQVILFLASDASRAITGAAIPVYGRS
jgi:NAD(P)-dependent dehydrogenase (short-subunit alcohol dehydrogenase family)